MTQDVHPFIHGRFIETFSLKWIVFQNDANRPTLHLWTFHHIILFKMNRLSKWRKTSTPIHGRFIETFSFIFQHDANLPTLHLWALEASPHVEKSDSFSRQSLNKSPIIGWWDGLCHFKNPLISKKMYDKAPTNEESDGLRLVKKWFIFKRNSR